MASSNCLSESTVLRLYQGGPEPSGTLREAFLRYILPGLTNPGTIGVYLTALNHWEANTTDPPWDEITDRELTAFRERLSAIPMSQDTVAKYCRHLRPILRRLGPKEHRNPEGKGLIDDVPYFGKLGAPKASEADAGEDDDRKRQASQVELAALYTACKVATWPDVPGVSPQAIWEAAIVCLYNLGPRCWEMWGCRETSGWQFSRLTTTDLKFWRPKKTDWLRLPLNLIVRAHLERIRTDRARIFPATTTRRSLYGQWRRIVESAKIECPSVFDLTPQCLRRTCQTTFDWHGKQQLGDWMLGHKKSGVGAEYYRQLRPYAERIVHKIPQPKVFLTALTDLQRDQLEQQRRARRKRQREREIAGQGRLFD